ncbi:hypothetical protein Ae201684P_008445 [Aphanomyces euteiches]|nr:hypothetical protein Ae201684P_008445 [Aphanomyces euteiches]
MSHRRVWIRMELFEQFALQLQSRCLTKLTPQHIKTAVVKLQQVAPVASLPAMTKRMTCGKASQKTSFSGKKTNAARIFWFVLVFLHHQIPITTHVAMDAQCLLDKDYFVKESVPFFKLILNLRMRLMQWRREDSPKGNIEALNVLSPGSPSSPHSIGLKDRSITETHYFTFVKNHLETLFVFLFDPTLTGANDVLIGPEDVDLLGFLFCGGDSFLLQQPAFGQVYPKWHKNNGRQHATKVCKWICKYLSLNEVLYPPIGFSIMSPLNLHTHVVQDMEVDQDNSPLIALPRPLVITSVSRTTLIKRAEEFAHGDLVIFGCHDSYIYVLGPMRHATIVASSNCKVVLAPNNGILTVNRCEGMKISAVCALLRVNNCLDSTFNVFTPRRSIFTGDNRGLQIGPFNAMYPHLAQHLEMSGFLFVPQTAGQWNKIINLETDSDTVKEPVMLQQPHHYAEVSVPVKMEAPVPVVLPITSPPEYSAVVHKMQENVDSLRRLIASDEFDPATKRALEHAIQVKFKEWLAASGNMRQVLDLVHLETARHNF